MPSLDSVDGPSSTVPSLLTGNLHRCIFLLALPALGEQLLNYCVGLFDTWLAGQVKTGIEEGLATSAVGVAAYVSWLATLLFALVGTGTSAIVARAWGRGDTARASRVASGSMVMAAGMGVFVAGLLYLIAPGYAMMQNFEGESLRIVVSYIRTDAIGEMFFVFCLVGSAALRGAGDMRTPLAVLGAVNVLNVYLSSAMVFGWWPFPALGIEGIVLGTVISKTIGGLAILAVLFVGRGGLKINPREWWPHPDDVRRIMKIGLPQVLDGILMWVGHSLFLMIIARLGTAGGGHPGKTYMAAHMIGVQVEGLTYLPATAWGYAAATVIGQCLGAGLRERARQAGHTAVRQCMVIAAFGALVFLFGAPWIYAHMTEWQSVRDIGVPAMRFLSWYQIPLVIMVVYIYAMRGAGDTRSPMFINTFGIVLIRLPIGALFGLWLGQGLIGAWTGMSVDVTVRAAIAYVWYGREHWAETQL